MSEVHMCIRGLCLAAIVIAASALAIPPEQACDNEKLTARGKAIVRDFHTTVLIGRDVDAAPWFPRPDYTQDSPEVPTELKGVMETFRACLAQAFPAS